MSNFNSHSNLKKSYFPINTHNQCSPERNNRICFLYENGIRSSSRHVHIFVHDQKELKLFFNIREFSYETCY